jgi:Cu/Ag efflux pump CusA
MAILILVMGVVSILHTPTDIFPNINIPVVSIIWNYNGLVPKENGRRLRMCPRLPQAGLLILDTFLLLFS